MPSISRFFGIKIYMHYDDHNPPHFHVKYNEFNALIDINDLKIMRGKLPPRVMGMIIEWANMHQNELIENWKRIEKHESLEKIDPLV